MADLPRQRRLIELDGSELAVELAGRNGGDAAELRAVIAGAPDVAVRVLRAGSSPVVLVDGRVVALTLGGPRIEGVLSRRGAQHRARLSARGASGRASDAAAPARSGQVLAPMPGRIIAVRVTAGQQVERGAALAVIEAMKMQNELFAPGSGVVTRVLVAAGDAVERGAVLVEIS